MKTENGVMGFTFQEESCGLLCSVPGLMLSLLKGNNFVAPLDVCNECMLEVQL
jgi:hypothetical protein